MKSPVSAESGLLAVFRVYLNLMKPFIGIEGGEVGFA
jgi:hypothetical protein